jgi:hypothetical protein
MNYFRLKGLSSKGEIKYESRIYFDKQKLKEIRSKMISSFENLTFLIYCKNDYVCK